MSLSVTIGSITRHIAESSLSISSTLGQVGTCELVLPDVLGTLTIQVGTTINITDGALILFSGFVTDTSIKLVHGNKRVMSISAQDWNALPSRHSSGEFEWPKDTRVNNIVRDLITNSPMNDDGVNLSMVPAGGGDLTTEVFNPVYTTLTDALNTLATLYKKFWKIDYTKTLQFGNWDAGIISAVVTDTSHNVRAQTLSSRATLEQYANYVIVRYSNFIKDFTQSFTGNATQTDFSVNNPVASQPTVKVNGTNQTIGVFGQDTGKQCYWTAGGREITFTTAPASGATVSVAYRGRVIDVKDAIDAAGVAAMQALVGGSGVFVKNINVSEDTTITDAQAIADRLLDKYKHISYVVTFESDTITSQIGDRITINVTGVPTGNYVVRSVRTNMMGKGLRRSYECVSGNILSDGFDAFSAMTGQSVLSGGTITLPPDTSSSTSGLASIGDNILVNADFESDLDGWTVYAPIASSVSVGSTGAKSGSKYLHLTPMTAYGDVSQYSDHSFPVAAGDWYTVEYWLRTSGYALGPGNEGISSPQINFQSASGTYISSIQSTVPLGTYDWTFFRVSGQVPENATRASLIAVWGKLMNGTVDIDAIRMYKGAPSQQTVGANLLLNPDFERALEEWNVEVPLISYTSIQQGGAKSGGKFMRIAGGQAIAAAVKHSYNGSGFYPVVEGQSFKFEGWFRTNSAVKAAGNNLYTQVGFYNAAQTYVGGFVFSYPEGTTSAWTHLTGHGVAPAGAVYLSFFAFIGKLQSGSIDIDSLQLYFEDAVEKTPLDYGALGDGNTDDSLAVQNAINDNTTLKIPAGYTFLTNGVYLSGKTSPYIYGGGTLKQKANAPAGSCLLLVTNCVEPYVEGLILDGNKTNQANAVDNLLYFSDCTGTITADAVTAKAGKSGGIIAISGTGAGVPTSVIYNACTVTGCTTALGILNSATAGLIPVANITDCISTGNSVDGISVKRVTDIAITNTQSTTNTGYGVKADTCGVRFSDCNVSSNTAGGFSPVGTTTYTAYNTVGLSDQRVPIAAPPPVASFAFALKDFNTQFGFDWSWVNPTTIGTASGTIRQVRYWVKTGGVFVLDGGWITTGTTFDLSSSLTASDGPFPKRSGEYEVEARIATLNFENTKSTWMTTSARVAIATLPIDSSLDNVNLNTNYNGSGFKVISNTDGTMDVSVQYGPPYPQPPSRVTPLIAALPMIELTDGNVLSYPAQPYTANPALDPPGNLQVVTVSMDKPSAPTTIYFHVLSVSTSGQLAYKPHGSASASAYIAISITQTMIDGAVSTNDAPVAPTGISIAVDSSKPDVFSLTPSWTLPSNKGGNVGYAIEVQYLDTPTGTLLSTGWQAPTTADQNGKNTTSVTIGPFARQTVDRYVFARVKAVNGNGLTSAWVTMSGTGTLVPKGVSYQQPSDISGFTFEIGGSSSQYTITPAFTNPTDPAIIGYQVNAQFYLDAGATTPDGTGTWIDLGARQDWTDKTAYGPYPRQTYTAYAKCRIRSLNSTGGYGNWITSSTIGTVDPVSAPPAPSGVSFTLATSTSSGAPQFRPTITVSANAALGTTENYIREMRFWSDAALTNPDSDWIPLGSVYRTTLVSSTEWFPWDKVTKYARVRVAGENKDGTPGTYVTSATVTLSASAGLDLTASDTSKLKGLEVVGGKMQPKVDGTELVIDSNGVVSQGVVNLFRAQGFDPAVFNVVGGMFKQTAISTSVLLAGLIATNSLVVGGGTSNVTVGPTSVTINGGSSTLTINSTGVTSSQMYTGSLQWTGSLIRYSGALQVGWWDNDGIYTAGTVRAYRVYGVQWGDINSKPTIVTSVNGQTGAVTISGGSAAWADITGKPTFGNSSGLNVGTSSGTVCAGDDSRLSDARTPTSHSHPLNTTDVEVRLADGSTQWIRTINISSTDTGNTGS
ncbi:hypothetical protein [Paludibaculum fermentans]|uniref:hypothetical protein n=1 Tax=Paludibaculum fermentans TaxID=1473598 RepID=UPI003EBC006C